MAVRGPTSLPSACDAIAVIAIAVLALGASACSSEPPPGQPADVQRPASRLALVSPEGDATGPIEFRWQGTSDAASYRLRFIDGREREFHTAELKETRYLLPASVMDQMETTVTYSWRVDALDKDGRTIDTTRVLSFLWTR